MTKNNLIVYT